MRAMGPSAGVVARWAIAAVAALVLVVTPLALQARPAQPLSIGADALAARMRGVRVDRLVRHD